MGVLPFEFINNQNRKSLNLKGNEKFTIKKINFLQPHKIIECKIVSHLIIKSVDI